MTGTIVNALAIVLGGLLGLCLKKGLPQRIEDSVMKIMGLVVGLIGLNGVLSSMMTVSAEGKLVSSGELLLLGSLVVGTVLGELVDIDARLERFGQSIEAKTKANGFSKGFISASLIYCVGAMAIIGALNDGLRGDSGVLFLKSSLDGISAVILAATMGVGVLFSAVPVLLYQGAIALSAGVIAPLVSDPLLNTICMVGYVMVIGIGINLTGIARFKVANMLPALLGPIAFHVVLSLL